MEDKEKYFMIGTVILAFVVLFIFLASVKEVDKSNDYGLKLESINYFCSENGIFKNCDSLSKVNKKGTRTRCYFHSEELGRLTWKVCRSGWEK